MQLQGPPLQRGGWGQVLSSKGQDSPAHPSFEEALFGWSQVLKDSGESFLHTKEQNQQLTVL